MKTIPVKTSHSMGKFAALLIAAACILVATNAHGDTNAVTKEKCLFCMQVQTSPYKEQYLSRLATATHSIVASSESSTNDEIQSDMEIDSVWAYNKSTTSSSSLDRHIDPFSSECLACHSYGAATNIEFNYRNFPAKGRGQNYAGGKDHPNGMDYSSYVAFGNGRYKSLPMFNSKMKFINGKVGCLTCHDPLNPDTGHLVMSDYKSALCKTCHNL